MNWFMKTTVPFAVLFAFVVLITGCVRSLHPIYTSSDVVYREDLIGTWAQSNGESTWHFTEAERDDRDRAYRLVITDKRGQPGTFLAHLVKLGNHHFLDLFPIAPQVANNGIYKFHFQRTHTFFRFKLHEGTLQLAWLSPTWLEKHLQSNPDALTHTFVTPTGHLPTRREENASERLLLTASTTELQAFFQLHANTAGAFEKPIEFSKTR